MPALIMCLLIIVISFAVCISKMGVVLGPLVAALVSIVVICFYACWQARAIDNFVRDMTRGL